MEMVSFSQIVPFSILGNGKVFILLFFGLVFFFFHNLNPQFTNLGAIQCTQCEGKGVNTKDHFNGQFKAGGLCWLCRYLVIFL